MPLPLRVLFIGATGAEAVAAELNRGGYEPGFEHVTTEQQLQGALAGKWDIAICDYDVEGLSAQKALQAIQSRGIDLPLIVVSGKIDDVEVLSVLKAGAADHLTRENLMRLNAAVEREIHASQIRRERLRLEEQFRQAQKME